MSAAAPLRQFSSVATPLADRKTRNGAARTLPPLTPSEQMCPPPPPRPQLPPPPADFRQCGERSRGPLDAGNATQRPPVAALPLLPPSSLLPPSQQQHQQRVHEPAAAAERGQTASAFVSASAHFVQAQPRSNRSTESVASAAAAGSSAAPAKTVAIIAAAKDSVDSARRSGSSSGGWQLFPPRHCAEAAKSAATTAAISAVGGGGGSGGHLPAPPPLQRLSDRLPPAAADYGRSPLAAATAAALTAAADANTEDYEDPWREAAQADAEVAAVAASSAAATAAVPVPQQGHLVVSRLGRLGIRNFDSRDSISTDDCPTDASSMRRSLYSVDTVRCGTPYEGHLSVNADTPASDAPLCSPDSAADDDEQAQHGGADASRTAATAAGPSVAAAAERQWLRRARWLGGSGGGSEEVALVNGKRARNEAPAGVTAPSVAAAAAAAAKHRKRTGTGTESTEYRVGSCWHCLINVPCPSLLTWLSLCLATLGWSVSGYMSASLIKKLLDHVEIQYSWFADPAIDEICIIVLGVVTVCVGVLFLVVATFSSENMSRYFFNTRSKNRMGRCINILVLALCYIAVMIWSGICAGIMIPITVLGIINFSDHCIQLDNLGFKMSTPKTTCEIEGLPDQVKEALVTLTICLAFSFVVQLSMVAFLVNVSANIRHLKESRYETYNAGSGGMVQSNPVTAVGGEQRDSAM